METHIKKMLTAEGMKQIHLQQLLWFTMKRDSRISQSCFTFLNQRFGTSVSVSRTDCDFWTSDHTAVQSANKCESPVNPHETDLPARVGNQLA